MVCFASATTSATSLASTKVLVDAIQLNIIDAEVIRMLEI